MSNPFAYLWRHPRRAGFVALNLVVLAALLGWGAFTAQPSNAGLGSLPALMLGYTGMTFLLVVWVVAWLAWAWLVASRQMRKRM